MSDSLRPQGLYSMPGFPLIHYLLEFAQIPIPWVHSLILCCPVLLLCSIFPSIKIFSIKFPLCIRWAKYWSFSFNISPSNEHSGLILRESVPRQIDKKSGVPEERGFWNSRGGGKDKHFSPPLYSLVLVT